MSTDLMDKQTAESSDIETITKLMNDLSMQNILISTKTILNPSDVMFLRNQSKFFQKMAAKVKANPQAFLRLLSKD